MKIDLLTREEYQKLLSEHKLGRPGTIASSIRASVETPLLMTLDSEKQACNRMGYAYAVRRKGNLQIKMIQVRNQIAMGPGLYVYIPRKPRIVNIGERHGR
jgi:hypothetical protein